MYEVGLGALLPTDLSRTACEWWGETATCVAPIVLCNHCATFIHPAHQGGWLPAFYQVLCNTHEFFFHFKPRCRISKEIFHLFALFDTPFQIMATPLPTDPTFQSIVASFRSRLTKAELDDFKFCSLKDVQQTIVDIQARQDKRRETKNLSRILGFLEAMTQFGTVVEVFLYTSEILAFVWGPLKFLLLVWCSPNRSVVILGREP